MLESGLINTDAAIWWCENMTQQSAIFLQNRRRPETSRTRPNKREIGKYREAAGSLQRQHLLFVWYVCTKPCAVLLEQLILSHLHFRLFLVGHLCITVRGFRLWHLCSYKIHISGGKTPKLFVKPHFQNGNTVNMQGCEWQLFSLSKKSSK